MKRFLLSLVILALVLSGLAAVAVNRLMSDVAYLETYLSNTTGREVRIGGIHDLRLGVESSLVMEGVSVANPDWADEPYLVQLDRLRIFLSVPSLWRKGPIVINNLDISGLRATLLAPAEQAPSWELAGSADETASREGPLQLPVVFQQAHIADSRILYRAPERELQAGLSGRLTGGEGLCLELTGQSRGHPVSFNGHTELTGDGLKLSGDGSYETWEISVNGELLDPLAFTGLDMRLAAKGVYSLQGETDSDSLQLPLVLDVQLSGSGERLEVRRGMLRSADSHLAIAGTLGNPNTLEGLALKLVLDTPDLKQLLPVTAANDVPVPLQADGLLRAKGGALRIDNLRGRSNDARLDGKLSLPLVADYRGATLKIKGTGDSVSAVLSPWLEKAPADAPFELDLAARWEPPVVKVETFKSQIGAHRLQGSFTARQEGEGTALKGRFQATGKQAHRMLAALGFDAEIPDESYMLKAEVALGGDGALSISGLDGQLGQSDVSGELQYQPGSPARLHAEFHAGTIDLRFFTEEYRRESRVTDTDDERRAGLRNKEPLTERQLGERLIPDTQLDFGWLNNLEGQLALTVDEVLLGDKLRSSAEYRFSIADGAMVSEKIQWQGGFSSGGARVEIRDLSPGLDMNVLLDTHRLPLFWLVLDNPDDGQKSDYKVALRGRGATLRELAASLDGTAVVRGGGGRINNGGLMFLLGDVFGEIAAQIDPEASKDQYTNLECHAAVLVFDSGLVDINPGAVLRSDQLDVALGGTVNLNNERFNVVFNTRARTGVGISASKMVTPFVKLGGNFSHPRVGVNVKGAVVSGGAAVATGGLSIVAEGMWDRWVATSKNPCDALFENADEASSRLKQMFGRP